MRFAIVCLAVALPGCATLTGAFELGGVHWSEGGYRDTRPHDADQAPVTSVLVTPREHRLTCFRTAPAHITRYDARYTFAYKLLAGFGVLSEGLTGTLLLASDHTGTGGRIAGGYVAADALVTIGLMIFTHKRVTRVEWPDPQYAVVESCPPDTGIELGGQLLAADEHGAIAGDHAALDAAVTGGSPLSIRVGGRSVPLPLGDDERRDRARVLVVMEHPSFVVPWPVEPPPPAPPAPAPIAGARP